MFLSALLFPAHRRLRCQGMHRAFYLGMSEKELNCPKVLRSPVDQCRLCPSLGVHAVLAHVDSSLYRRLLRYSPFSSLPQSQLSAGHRFAPRLQRMECWDHDETARYNR